MFPYDRIIRVPLFPMSQMILDHLPLTLSTTSSVMNIDIDKLGHLIHPELHQFGLRHPQSSEYIVIIGRDIMNQLTGIPEDRIRDIYQDLTSPGCAKIFGYPFILNGESQGVSFMPPINPITSPKREISDRERMSSAHITAAVKSVAERGAAQKGEYADGWKACIRVLCQNLGVDVPHGIPFQGMRVDDLTSEIIAEMSHARST